MKIAQITCSYLPNLNGITNVVYNFARQAERYKHEVTIYTPFYKNIFKYSKNESKEKNHIIANSHSIIYIKSILKYGNAAFAPQLLLRLSNFDIIHLHYPFFGANEIILLNKILNKKQTLIITYHMDFIANNIIKKILKTPSNLLSNHLFKKANTITVSSLDYAINCKNKKLLNRYIDKLVEIPLGHNAIIKPKNIDPQLKLKYKIKKDQKVLLFVAALDNAHYFKGLNNLLQSLKNLKNLNIKLLVVGDGELKSYYKQKTITLGIDNKVEFCGRVNDSQLNNIYNLADLFILPSINTCEAFGIVLVDALASKTPVITSDLPGVRSVIDNNINGILIKPNDISSLTYAIKSIISKEQKLSSMGIAGYAKARQKYNWEKIGDKLNKLYLAKH